MKYILLILLINYSYCRPITSSINLDDKPTVVNKHLTKNITSKNKRYANTFTTTITTTFTSSIHNIYNISNIINISNKIYVNNTTHSVPLNEINSNITNLSRSKPNSNNTSTSNTDSIISSCVAVGCLALFVLSLIFCRCTPGQKCYVDKTMC